MQTYASDVLYHFVGREHSEQHDRNFRVLCEILKSMEVRPNLVTGRSGITYRVDPNRPMQNGELSEQSVSCFCDIHLSHLSPVHTSKYGKFGIGVDRQWLAHWGGRPVAYLPILKSVPMTGPDRLRREVLLVYQSLYHHFGVDEPEEKVTVKTWGEPPATANEAALEAASLLARDVIAFFKVYDVELPDDHPENYYMEREWRKFGKLPLELPLRQIVVPSEWAPRLAEQFPEHAEKIVELRNENASSIE